MVEVQKILGGNLLTGNLLTACSFRKEEACCFFLHLGKVKQHAQENLYGGGGMGEIGEGD